MNNEVDENSVIRKFRTTENHGNLKGSKYEE